MVDVVDALRFKEIEHKFVVADDFDLPRFRDALTALAPTRTRAIGVRDRYFLTESGRERRFVIRHRYDATLHHLTVKAIETDTEVRAEINLDLGQHAGDQAAQVDAFVDRLGVVWRGTLHKDLEVWYFPDCEVVHYQATAVNGGADLQVGSPCTVRCVEFEATRKSSLEDALAIVQKYERATGFDQALRSRLSLPQILFPEMASYLH